MSGANGITRLVVRAYRLLDRLHSQGRHRSAQWVSIGCRVITGVEIEPGAKLGPNLLIHHGHGVVIGREVVAGSHCSLFHQVTIGSTPDGYPVIGDRVTICAGAKVLGNITIGDDVVIGANAVVLDDVPSGHTAVGVPARVKPRSATGRGIAPSDKGRHRPA